MRKANNTQDTSRLVEDPIARKDRVNRRCLKIPGSAGCGGTFLLAKLKQIRDLQSRVHSNEKNVPPRNRNPG